MYNTLSTSILIFLLLVRYYSGSILLDFYLIIYTLKQYNEWIKIEWMTLMS